ncbi:MAG: hypothetical protein M1818_006732 [Claussenomyces sp. TS43310]|nr:MAG: hypothetical protein M1818_006732 [Claussenomyces sp. TS43310]
MRIHQLVDANPLMIQLTFPKNGDITDPPATEASSASQIIHYARPVGQDLPGIPLETKAFKFCDTCLQNQHLWASALAQYSDETDLTASRAVDHDFLRFKRNLEERYPQVCEDCEDGATEHLERANRMARADNLRIKLAQTRANRGTGKTRTWLEFFSFWGGMLYWLGTAGQITLCLVGIIEGAMLRLLQACIAIQPFQDLEDPLLSIGSEDHPSAFVLSMCKIQEPLLAWSGTFVEGSYMLARWTLILTILSCWWNPKFRNMIRGFDRHIHGFLNWYYYQLILLVTRVLFRSIVGTGVLAQDDAPATMAAHCFMLFFTVFIAVVSRNSIRVDHMKLFVSTPEKPRPRVQRKKNNSSFNDSGMGQALDKVLFEDDLATHEFDSRTRSHTTPLRSHTESQALGLPEKAGQVSFPEPNIHMSQMTDAEAILFMTNGQLPDRMQDESDEMDWTPSVSTYTTFNPQISRQLPAKLSSPDSTVTAQQPFWFKVPPAPVTPAQKLRNPPNQPRLQLSSQERKENFFNDMTQRQPNFTRRGLPLEEERREMNLAQQRFFPEPAADAALGLSEYMEKTFTLKSTTIDHDLTTNNNIASKIQSLPMKGKMIHGIAIVMLAMIFGGWNMAYSNRSLPTYSITMGIMTICSGVSLKIICDYALTDWAKRNAGLRSALMITFAGVETAAAGFNMLEIWAGRGASSSCQSQGAILIGVMLVQEMWSLLL